MPKPRVLTGLAALDDILGGGLRPGRITVVAARTAMGKSMLALAMARNCALRQGRPAQVVSLEMSNQGLLERTLAAETGVLTEKLRRRTLEPSDFALLHAFDRLGDRSGGPRPSDRGRRCRRRHRLCGCG
ncbi:DnaB-like helicase C-terminal domain-containing protein [Streptomyces tendae]